MKKLFTLCLICQRAEVLLGMKKRGFGAGRWNGFGGKVLEQEAIEEAAKRETKEEAKIEIKNFSKAGIIEFEFQGKPDILEVHIFKADNFLGTPSETEEMKPKWFKTDEIPFEEMWPDDKYWLPMFMDGKKFRGKFLFGKNDSILKQELWEADDI
ncbi:MAG: 8-oxo-dGTP diphosphatase [Candidatus Staskawiczbacteria bacterium]|nr:8-oxo-dGTP diphosphatase [Candidatus Staskawiczbacteria bacterium]